MTHEDNEMSAPMLGSHGEPPIANHYDGRMWVEADRYTELLRKYATLAAEQQPVLTAAEREAIAWATLTAKHSVGKANQYDTLQALLERLG